MGRRLNLPTPTVINTELVPFDESFYIEPNGQTEQWYYDNTETYSPNRKLQPLTLTPHISVFDKDTRQSYTPSFYVVKWYEKSYINGAYVETEITNITDGANVDYVKVGNTLLVKKNVSYTRAVTVRCEATYIDPRDSGIRYTTSDSVNLTCNRDAIVEFPTLDILAPSSQSYNPLLDYRGSDYEPPLFLKAYAEYAGTDISDDVWYEWYAIENGIERPVQEMSWYSGGQHSKELMINPLYGENITILLRAKADEEAEDYYPSQVIRNVTWRIPDVDTHVVCVNGGAVRNDTTTMTFETICNSNHRVISDDVKKENLLFNWKIRASNSTQEIDMGWGQTKTINASDLRHTIGSSSTLASTIVIPYVYLLGAYEHVTSGIAGRDNVVYDEGFPVYDRF